MLPFIFFIALFTEQQDNIDKSGIRWSFSTKSEENHFIFPGSMKKKKNTIRILTSRIQEGKEACFLLKNKVSFWFGYSIAHTAYPAIRA